MNQTLPFRSAGYIASPACGKTIADDAIHPVQRNGRVWFTRLGINGVMNFTRRGKVKSYLSSSLTMNFHSCSSATESTSHGVQWCSCTHHTWSPTFTSVHVVTYYKVVSTGSWVAKCPSTYLPSEPCQCTGPVAWENVNINISVGSGGTCSHAGYHGNSSISDLRFSGCASVQLHRRVYHEALISHGRELKWIKVHLCRKYIVHVTSWQNSRELIHLWSKTIQDVTRYSVMFNRRDCYSDCLS